MSHELRAKLIKTMLDDFLLQVNKPARYIGQEWNVAKKDFTAAGIRFALAFPDLYEIGMSNLGLRILYGVLNNIPDVACERFFACGIDMEGALRQQKEEIFSLESKRPLKEFDIVGFSLGSELDFTNVLGILSLGNIPLKASLRDSAYPLVIGGGPCALNPEPMHEFFDLFVIGEAEDLILEIIGTYRKNKAGFKAGEISKQDLLLELSKIEGVYVPSLYEAVYNCAGGIEEFKPRTAAAPIKIKKRIVKDLDSTFFPLDWLVPYIQIVHDRLTLEIMRGCVNRCRFCQARQQYYPLRIRSIENTVSLAQESYRRSGYEEVSLCGLSVSDYPKIEELLSRLVGTFRHKAVGVSLPSLKARSMVGKLSSLIASIKKTGLTFAPEAGTQRLRELLNKDFDEEELLACLQQAYGAGYQRVKLYFMIGLPTETEDDLEAIVDLSARVSELRRKVAGRPAEVNISINTLIPKPHTPLQWFAMEGLEGIKAKQDYLRNKIKKYKKLNLSFQCRQMSFLEGVLSRGDRRLSQVILRAHELGARFDAWQDHFSMEKWLEAFRQAGIDPQAYLKEIPRQNLLPWDFVDVGISKDVLRDEFNKVIAFREEALYNSTTFK